MPIQPFAETDDNFTSLSNYMLDIIMPALPANAWKVLCFIYRKTRGWKKTSDALSYTQIAAGTGIKSSATISQALQELEVKKYILKTTGDKWDTVTYALNAALEIEASASENEAVSIASKTEATSEIEASVASEIKALSLQKLNTQKKRNKDKETNTPAPRQSADTGSDHQRLMQMYQEILPDKRITNGRQEGSAAKAILQAGYTPEQAIQVYEYLKRRNFWADQHLSLQTVNKQMGAVLAALEHGSNSNGTTKRSIQQSAGRDFQRAKWTEIGDNSPL